VFPLESENPWRELWAGPPTSKKMDHLNENGHPTHPNVESPRVNKSVVLPQEHIPNDVINHLGGRNIFN
jgi:hypothetical protein